MIDDFSSGKEYARCCIDKEYPINKCYQFILDCKSRADRGYPLALIHSGRLSNHQMLVVGQKYSEHLIVWQAIFYNIKWSMLLVDEVIQLWDKCSELVFLSEFEIRQVSPIVDIKIELKSTSTAISNKPLIPFYISTPVVERSKMYYSDEKKKAILKLLTHSDVFKSGTCSEQAKAEKVKYRLDRFRALPLNRFSVDSLITIGSHVGLDYVWGIIIPVLSQHKITGRQIEDLALNAKSASVRKYFELSVDLNMITISVMAKLQRAIGFEISDLINTIAMRHSSLPKGDEGLSTL